VRYDFGGRAAALAIANALLAAAKASQEATLQSAFANVEKAIARPTQHRGDCVASREIVQTAHDSSNVAKALMDRGCRADQR
jgi:outer membrane protein